VVHKPGLNAGKEGFLESSWKTTEGSGCHHRAGKQYFRALFNPLNALKCKKTGFLNKT
jgi:hypothetical protein